MLHNGNIRIFYNVKQAEFGKLVTVHITDIKPRNNSKLGKGRIRCKMVVQESLWVVMEGYPKGVNKMPNSQAYINRYVEDEGELIGASARSLESRGNVTVYRDVTSYWDVTV